MATRFEDRVHTPLSREEAKRLVAELLQLVDDAVPSEATDLSYATSEPPPALEGLSIASRFDLEQSEDNDFGELLEDLEMSVLTEKPPTAEGAVARARATGYAESSFVFEPEAMALLPECRSTIELRYLARFEQNRAFVAVLKRLLDRAAPAVVESGEGTRYETVESVARSYGSLWTKTPAAQTAAERAAAERARQEAKRRRKPRQAKPGEVEAVALREGLVAILEGADPFMKQALQRAFADAPRTVALYAGALVEGGAAADQGLAKALGSTAKEIAEARATLQRLLDDLPRD